MAYEVIKTIGGRQYRYSQESYREGGKVRTRNTYLGPVDGVRRKGGITGFVQTLVRKKDRREDIGESEAETRARVGREEAERSKNARVNELLTAPTISLDAISEIADAQHSSDAIGAADTQAGESEGEPSSGSP
jgi:hypothetical protein